MTENCNFRAWKLIKIGNFQLKRGSKSIENRPWAGVPGDPENPVRNGKNRRFLQKIAIPVSIPGFAIQRGFLGSKGGAKTYPKKCNFRRKRPLFGPGGPAGPVWPGGPWTQGPPLELQSRPSGTAPRALWQLKTRSKPVPDPWKWAGPLKSGPDPQFSIENGGSPENRSRNAKKCKNRPRKPVPKPPPQEWFFGPGHFSHWFRSWFPDPVSEGPLCIYRTLPVR